jgi:hypothetical protein
VSKKKKPFYSVRPPTKKKPRTIEVPEDFESQTIVWHISTICREGNWGWEKVGREVFWKDIVKKLSLLESMTWANIKAGRRGKTIPVSRICREAQRHLSAIRQDDTDKLFELRLSAKERVWGIRDRRVLRVLWWDPKHTVCPSKRKHT